MSKSKLPVTRLSPQEEEYRMSYGGLPNDREALLKYAAEKYPFRQAALDKAMQYVESCVWQDVEFVLYLVPKPTPRPRSNGHHFYVKGAAENKKFIRKYIDRNIIYTRCEISAIAYLPIPTSSMTNAEIYLAESGILSPMCAADVDNILKTYMDMMQGHLLLNDNLVTLGQLEKFYSLKPRLELKIRYQIGFDSRFNEKRMYNSKGYKDEFSNTK